MFERFAHTARTVVEDARHEAGRRGDRRIGTEHMLLALLQDQEAAQALGVDSEAARRAADDLDRAALTAVGIDLGDANPNGRAALGRHVPFTAGAKTVIKQSLAYATKEKATRITTRHLVLALLDRGEPDPAAAILAALHIDPDAVRQRLQPPA